MNSTIFIKNEFFLESGWRVNMKYIYPLFYNNVFANFIAPSLSGISMKDEENTIELNSPSFCGLSS